ncbi:hypothetical protein DPX16_21256 [Anabarilius grahami]|uniref:Uncharacterized protein n=1 Tax=Anabarilius grahami TaxID=495550 RepID=A0A3N0XS48_ANAGA|nr:hypothetical protein DPX16_21256 [Anabarilius grahami]
MQSCLREQATLLPPLTPLHSSQRLPEPSPESMQVDVTRLSSEESTYSLLAFYLNTGQTSWPGLHHLQDTTIKILVGALHLEQTHFLVLEGSVVDIVFGHPWWCKHSPVLSWHIGEIIKWSSECFKTCMIPVQRPTHSRKESLSQGTAAPLHPSDDHHECVACLGHAHTGAALVKMSCSHCKTMSLATLCFKESDPTPLPAWDVRPKLSTLPSHAEPCRP